EEARAGALPLEARVVDGVLGPLDPPRPPVEERAVRSRRLEVEEALWVDLREALGLPRFRQITAGKRGSLAAVVPPAERSHEHRPPQRRPLENPKLLSH